MKPSRPSIVIVLSAAGALVCLAVFVAILGIPSWLDVYGLTPAMIGLIAALLLALVSIALLACANRAQRRRHRQSQEAEELFRLAFESGSTGMLIVDTGGRILLVNSQIERLFGYRRDELVDQSVELLVPEPFRAAHIAQRRNFLLGPGALRSMGTGRELYGRRKDGSQFAVEIGLIPLQTAQRILVLGTVIDITERRRVAEQVRTVNAQLSRMNEELEVRVRERTAALEQANAELQSFAHSVAHDLRAPLRNMQGFARALLEDYGPKLGDDGAQYAERIARAAARLDALIHALLAYSRLTYSEIELKPVELERLTARIVHDLEPQIRASQGSVEIEGPLPPVIAHPPTLEQAITNLLSNALKFARRGVAPRVRVSARRAADRVHLAVADNGIGIEAQYHERIFRVFERLHGQDEYPGTGIGLAIVRKSIERMGGSVRLDSTPRVGSTFWIELKAAADEPADVQGAHR